MAWYYGAVKQKISVNYTKGGMVRPFLGVVLHIEEGTEAGTRGWFNMTVEQRQAALDALWEKNGKKGNKLTAYASSAHFGNPKSGPLEQFVDTDDMSWAQGTGNTRWISVENEGFSGDALTGSQIENLVRLMVWLRVNEDIPLQVTDDPDGRGGLGTHTMGGVPWGNHPMCPGDKIIAQRDEIVKRANDMYDSAMKMKPDAITSA